MTTPALYPLRFQPLFKDYPWGGRNLQRVLGRVIPDGTVAESWEISGHPHGLTTVVNGPLAGLDLAQVQQRLGPALVGNRSLQALDLGKFPLLVKLLDANRWLSVQVHPDDAYALAHEGELGKTEMWVVIHREPQAELIFGWRPGTDPKSIAAALAAGDVETLLHRVPVEVGDVFFVPAGSVHALGPGIIVAEIQQNSDTTYRIYDWGRLGHDGQPRPLHIDKALAVMDARQVAPAASEPMVLVDEDIRLERIATCPYFCTERLCMPEGGTFLGDCDGETFEIWGLLTGTATISWGGLGETITGVAWVLLPAQMGAYEIRADAGSTLLRVYVPETQAIGAGQPP